MNSSIIRMVKPRGLYQTFRMPVLRGLVVAQLLHRPNFEALVDEHRARLDQLPTNPVVLSGYESLVAALKSLVSLTALLSGKTAPQPQGDSTEVLSRGSGRTLSRPEGKLRAVET